MRGGEAMCCAAALRQAGLACSDRTDGVWQRGVGVAALGTDTVVTRHSLAVVYALVATRVVGTGARMALTSLICDGPHIVSKLLNW